MANPADLATTCWTCKPLVKYVELTQDFADKLSETLHDPMLMLFGALAGLWIVLSGIRLALRMTEHTEIIKDFVFISITGILLGSQSTQLISYVYSSAVSIMGASSAAVFSIAGGVQDSSGYDGLVALAANGEKAVYKVFQAAGAIWRAGALYELGNYAYAIVLVVPYFLLVVAYSSQVVVAIFRATMIGVFAPFLFMAFAFNWGRGMAQSGAKTLLASILVLFASTAALALTIFGVNTLSIDPASLSGDQLNEFASITNPEFLVILFLGWMGTALMTEGTSQANSIAQTALTNAAAGILTAGVSGSALFGLKKSREVAGMLGQFGGQMHDRLWEGATKAAGADLADKFRNINKPGGGS
ncbi:type IV secretion system protein [Magnetospirillum sp. UT-4]|uniref:type IV secretion system protein n=1 Tax=Magnetospirillum sp. UT-4 TaxID=2681467 RepID=UPI00137EBDCA|nr:type IV secretion system protein [Magnetospirillum sp. UT-4]CAA7619323.1 Membrane protein [Magnetospirillum sp. UT-4]